MPHPNPGPCRVPLTMIDGTGENVVGVPIDLGSEYTNITQQLLYEIWQTLLLILAASGGITMTKIASFDIGDGQAGTPVAGTNVLNLANIQGQNLFDVNLLVIREGIELPYSSAVTIKTIRRLNIPATSGGFTFEPGMGQFNPGEHFDLYVVGANNSAAV